MTEKVINNFLHWRNRNLPWYPRRGDRKHLAQLFSKLQLNRGVEIGTREGYYAEILCKSNPNLKLTCIDPYMGHQEKHYGSAKDRLSKYGVEIIRKKSMDAVYLFKDKSLDFIYIDGNHTFDYVMEDILKWVPKVRIGGIVAGHDYVTASIDVVHAVDAYTRSHNINPWYVTRETIPSFFWVNK